MKFFFFPSFWLLTGLLFLNGCTPTAHTLVADAESDANMQKTNSGSTAFASYPQETSDSERLFRLWQRRTQKGSIGDYPVGPGDILEISVPDMEELRNRTVRVSGEGTISLPFVGVVRASGLTEMGLREEIRRRLQENYMHNPQVNLFVREYRSRQVAVTGAVKDPGLYSLSSKADTLFDMISRAGGMTDKAAPRIHFIPAKPVEKEKAKEIASALPARLVSKDPSLLILERVDPIEIDLKSLTRGGNRTYLNLPARPGDVIMVPGSGEVLVEGWVGRPGSYKITPGLTVLGAVAAARGPLFAADTSSVKIIRTNKTGERVAFLANLESIKNGEEPDIPIRQGDVIEVSSSGPKLVALGFYNFFSTVFRIGARVTLFRGN